MGLLLQHMVACMALAVQDVVRNGFNDKNESDIEIS